MTERPSCTRCQRRPAGTPRWEAERGLCHACYVALGKLGELTVLPLQRATMGVSRDCTCKRARHQHGSRLAFVVDRCRCEPCRDANTGYERERRRLAAERQWNPDRPATPGDLVDAIPAREHLKQLAAAGMGPKTIAAKSGIGHGSISAILYGKPSPDPQERRPPRRRITRDLEQRILAVQLDLADGAMIPAAGAQRRLQALVAIGWSQSQLGRLLGISHPRNASALINSRKQVTVITHRRVLVLYERLWNQPPPERTRREKQAATRARRHAAERRWPPPMWWDEDRIDDPTYHPRGPGRVA